MKGAQFCEPVNEYRKNGDQLEHHFYFGISFRCIPEIHPNLGLILSTGNYAQVWHNKSETLLQLATKFRLQMMRGANFVPSWDEVIVAYSIRTHFVPWWDEVKSIVNLATLFEPAFSTCDQHGHKLILYHNFGPTWSEVKLCPTWTQFSERTSGHHDQKLTLLTPTCDQIEHKLIRLSALHSNFCPSWAEVRYGTCGQVGHKLPGFRKRAVTSAHVGRKLKAGHFRTSCPEVEYRGHQDKLSWSWNRQLRAKLARSCMK